MRLSVLVQGHCSLAELRSLWFGSKVFFWPLPGGDHPSLGSFCWLFAFAAGGSLDEAQSTP